MISPITFSGAYPVAAVPYGKKSEQERTKVSGQRYDQVQFSSQLSEMDKCMKEAAGQLVRQIRTRPSSQTLADLRQQVSSGTYQVNAQEIAARMLLLKET